MATDRNKIIVLSIALAVSSNAVADNADHCVSIVDSKDRLECYDRALRPAKSADKKEANSPPPKSMDTNVVSRAKGIAKRGHGKTNLGASRCLKRGVAPEG